MDLGLLGLTIVVIALAFMWCMNLSKFFRHRCLDCGFTGRLRTVTPWNLVKFLLLLIFPEAMGAKICPQCKSHRVEVAWPGESKHDENGKGRDNTTLPKE